MKRCAKCGEEKPTTEFHRNRNKRDGCNAYCKVCNCANRSAWYARHPLAAVMYRTANREKIAAGKRAALTDRDYARRKNLREKHGITLEDFEVMEIAQRRSCAICGTRPPEGKVLHVDHCHSTGAIRGLLCGACNRALGLLRDDPQVAWNAAKYLFLTKPGALEEMMKLANEGSEHDDRTSNTN